MKPLSSSTVCHPSETHALTPTINSRRQCSDDALVSISPPTILIVDDDLAVAKLLKDALSIWGFKVVLASNGQEGLQVLASQNVDGILLDIHMPVMDGRTMLDEMRWSGYQMPVIVMSGGVDALTLNQLMEEGVQGFMSKPFALPSLRKLCMAVFDRLPGDVYSDAQLSVA